jgi:hypothetical protein
MVNMTMGKKENCMNETKEKIKQVSRKVITITKVGYVFCALGIFGCIIGSVICGYIAYTDQAKQFLSDHPEILEHLSTDIDTGSLLHIRNSVLAYADYRTAFSNMMVECLGGILGLALTIAVFHYISKVFKKIVESDTPFTYEIMKNLKVMFILITVICVMNSLVLGLVVGFILMCLYYIFRYGCELQTESDETL